MDKRLGYVVDLPGIDVLTRMTHWVKEVLLSVLCECAGKQRKGLRRHVKARTPDVGSVSTVVSSHESTTHESRDGVR